MINEISKATHYSEDEIFGRCRKSDLCMVRYSYWKLLRDKGKEPYHLIARLNGRSHATIMNGITRLVNLLEVNDEKALSAWNLVKNIEYDNSSRF